MDSSPAVLRCGNCDSEAVREISGVLLQGLALACVQITAGDLFVSPGSVADGLRNEMVGHLVRAADETEDFADPAKFVSDGIDGFVDSRRNFLSRVSGLLSAEIRGEKVRDFATGLAESDFWPADHRAAVAEVILQRAATTFSCSEKFESPEALDHHRKSECRLRRVACVNEGCREQLSAMHISDHDDNCEFKALPCRLGCETHPMRGEMDQHCTTVCPMKLVGCPFRRIGCPSSVPQKDLENHCSEAVERHLLAALDIIGSQGAALEELKQRVFLLEKAQTLNEQSGRLDARSLTLSVKEQEAKSAKLERDLRDRDARLNRLERELRALKQPQ